jgi:16S rRNA (guanine527-N7)-methyltransferase
LVLRHLKPGGHCLFLKGAEAAKEVELARKTCSFEVETFPSLTSGEGVVLKISQIRSLP